MVILDDFMVTDRVAIVTGAGQGIGEDIALALAEAGADVVVAARTQTDIDDTAAKVRERGREALAVPCDVMETLQLEHLIAATEERFGRLDILVNNAGGSFPKPALETSERAFEKVVRFNLTSPFLLTRLAIPRMVETAGAGVVVNISSGASVQAVGGMVGYAAAKAGLNQLTRVLAGEFAPKVRVNAIVVGQILTPGARSVLSDDMIEHAAHNIPMARLGDVRDVAACALYLAAPASAWITGRMFDVDGGADVPPLEFPVPGL
jgi:7-alpha-hydroxysteroid dehydrogenase